MKGPTTIFPMKSMADKRKEAGKSTKSAMTVKPTSEAVSIDEELQRAAEAFGKEATLSDEELMEAAVILEQMQIVGGEEHGQPGDLIEGVCQVHGQHDHPR